MDLALKKDIMTQIFPLSEGTFTVGHDKIFQTFDENTDELNERPTGSLLVEVQPFAVVNDKDIILLDTGLGFHHHNGKAMLEKALAQHNILPSEVTKVLMSHLHKDHAGGLLPDFFPNALIYIYKEELDFAEKTGMPSYYIQDLQWLKTAANVRWLEGEAGTIDGYIHFRHSGGHAPFHIVFWIDDEEGGSIFFGGDEAPQWKQMKVKYMAKYDYDGRRAMELRQQWLEEGTTKGWRFLFYHDIKIPVSQF